MDSAETILEILDSAAQAFTFPMMDNGYVYPAATRLSLFRSSEDWALVIELFGFSPRAGLPDLSLITLASRIHRQKARGNFASEAGWDTYLTNHPHDETSITYPVGEGLWIDPDGEETVAESGEVRLRDLTVPLPDPAEYGDVGIELESERPAIFEFCRYLAAHWRDDVLATPAERRVNVLPEMEQILLLEDWHHPDTCEGELPGETGTFRQLAQVLSTGDVSLYHTSEEPNTHWRHWPDAGTL